MGLLDKLKPQPRWKHADPAVRLEGVREMDDLAELAALAETDPDVKVRRAALARVDDVDVLARVAGGDPDADLRDRAAERLTAIACRGVEGSSPDVEAMRRAVQALTDPRRLAAVAKSDAPEAIRAEALRLTGDERSIGSIARQARQEATAVQALGRLTDANEILEVALNAGHKDVALAAFERIAAGVPDLGTLRSVELRAQHKAVGRRARALIQEIEAAEAARQAAALERQRRESHLVEAVEALAEVSDVAVVKAELARLSDNWQALGVVEPASIERFGRGVEAAKATMARREREIEEELERQRTRQEAIATRIALCERVETLDGEDAVAQLVPIEEEWRSLLPISETGAQAEQLAERFSRAVASCRSRHEMGATLATTRASLEALVTEAETLAAREDTDLAAERWHELAREARSLTTTLESASRPATDLAERLAAVAAAFRLKDDAHKAEVAASREVKLSQIRRLVDRARRAAEADAMTLREGERLMRDLATAISEANATEDAPELHRAASELSVWQEKVAPRVRELREMDEWRKFANAQRQEQLISMAEAIVASLKTDEESGKTSDLPATAKALRELHAEWQLVAEAPRQTAQRLWDRFRTATDFIRSRCEPFFAKRREEREASRARRVSVVEEAESLAQSADWAAAASRLQALQAEWQALGHPASDSERELGQRFRAACNTFFVRRREDLADRKKVWTDNLAQKEALCERAEALADSSDWDTAAAELKKLQADWKTIGPVRKNKSDAVWTRFRAAADRFFERYHHRHEIALAGKLAEREALVVELEALAGMPAESTPADAADAVQRLRTTWNRAVPVPVPGMKQLNDRWQAAFSELLASRPQLFAGTELDPKAVVQRMEKLVARVEALVAEPRQSQDSKLSATEMLAAKLRNALASNAMGGRGHEESKHRGAIDSAKEAVASWQRLPPVHTPEAEALAARFRDACRKIGVGEFGRRQQSGHDGRKDRRPSATPAPVEDRQPEPAAV
jgi:hypothetical protein